MNKKCEEFRKGNIYIKEIPGHSYLVEGKVKSWGQLTPEEKEVVLETRKKEQENKLTKITKPNTQPTQSEIEDFWYNR